MICQCVNVVNEIVGENVSGGEIVGYESVAKLRWMFFNQF